MDEVPVECHNNNNNNNNNNNSDYKSNKITIMHQIQKRFALLPQCFAVKVVDFTDR
jgi:hypothetical protein